jgi:uncharacterized protein YndB with AHSA1/START domain
MDFEPGPRGRLWERHAGGADFEVGRVRAWEPPHRLVFEWRQGNFAPDETTVVEVRFEPAAGGGTRVTLEHRGWSAFATDHPVRHGVVGGAFTGMMAGFWRELLDAFAATGART